MQSQTQDTTPATQPEFTIQKIFAKDFSFESPNTPGIFIAETKTDAQVDIKTDSISLDAQTFEVTLAITLTAKSSDRVVFLAEVKQAGIFTLKNIPAPEKNSLLGSYCPSVLFPYAREMMSSMISRGGFPPFQLAPINFDALYLEQQAQQQAQPTPTDPATLN